MAENPVRYRYKERTYPQSGIQMLIPPLRPNGLHREIVSNMEANLERGIQDGHDRARPLNSLAQTPASVRLASLTFHDTCDAE